MVKIIIRRLWHEAVNLLGKQGLKLIEFYEKQTRLEDSYIRCLHQTSDLSGSQGKH
jgi:hypothetical protein